MTEPSGWVWSSPFPLQAAPDAASRTACDEPGGSSSLRNHERCHARSAMLESKVDNQLNVKDGQRPRRRQQVPIGRWHRRPAAQYVPAATTCLERWRHRSFPGDRVTRWPDGARDVVPARLARRPGSWRRWATGFLRNVSIGGREASTADQVPPPFPTTNGRRSLCRTPLTGTTTAPVTDVGRERLRGAVAVLATAAAACRKAAANECKDSVSSRAEWTAFLMVAFS